MLSTSQGSRVRRRSVVHPRLRSSANQRVDSTNSYKTRNSSFARLRNSRTTGILVSKNNKCNNGIYVDIYPLDGLYKCTTIQKIKAKWIHLQNILAHAYAFNINPSFITRAASKMLRSPFVYYNSRKVYKYVNRMASSVSWANAEKVGIVVFNPYPFHKNCFNKGDFASTEYLGYEDVKIPVPAGYKNILTVLYGNYMAFPPVEKRGLWHDFTFDPDTPYKDWKDINNKK